MNIKNKLASAKDAVARNKTKILATTTVVATGAAVMMRIGLNQHDDFLREKGLYEEFYAQTDDE
jgi:hypothetical protein